MDIWRGLGSDLIPVAQSIDVVSKRIPAIGCETDWTRAQVVQIFLAFFPVKFVRDRSNPAVTALSCGDGRDDGSRRRTVGEENESLDSVPLQRRNGFTGGSPSRARIGPLNTDRVPIKLGSNRGVVAFDNSQNVNCLQGIR